MNDTEPADTGATDNGSAPTDSDAGAPVVWDLQQPTRPADLGSKVDRFAEVDGPATIQVIFPSGREVVGTFERGGLAEVGSTSDDAPIDQVTLLSVVDSPEDLRAEIAAFTEEFGPLGEEIDGFVTEYETAFAQNGTVGPDDFGGVGAGRSVRRFEAEPQDGISPALGIRVSGGVSLRWSLRFDPASEPDAS